MMDFVDAHSVPYRAGNRKQAVRCGMLERVADVVEGKSIRVQTAHPDIEHAQSLLQHFGKGPSYGHHFPDAFHLRPDARGRTSKLPEIPPWDLADEIVQRRLEKSRR